MNNAQPERLVIDQLETPIGPALFATDEQGALRSLYFGDFEQRMLRLLRTHYGRVDPEAGRAPAQVRHALEAYFSGDVEALTGLAWATGGTPFQRKVWTALTEIPAGTTLSYGALAVKIGAPKAVRAVGLANGANPISVVVPCHRVIGSDGSLTGYGGGLERKRWLLAHEGVSIGGVSMPDQPRLL
ncbi:methylated-DNA--[protein]-cysteine S-methyltransferase [Microvirga sp. 2TAF3]|uniref:methylated-DNA--[protein]-cysteine S-methyltransferase n=1 Tax=Microvirga sp. 2TAF3 TaxID=3233014 RepID=UPI003F9D01F6